MAAREEHPVMAGMTHHGVNSVHKAVDVIELLAKTRNGLPLKVIAQQLQVNESTLHHTLTTLKQRGFIRQDPDSRTYHIGYHLLGVVNRYLNGLDLYTASNGPIGQLRDESGEMTYLTVFPGDKPVPVIELMGWKPILCRRTVRDDDMWLHACASGKAYLAFAPTSYVDRLLTAAPLKRFTANTITDPDELRAELGAIRRKGYAVDREEDVEGVMCVAAPVLGSRSECVATVSVSFSRTGAERINEVASLVVTTAEAISANLGNIPRSLYAASAPPVAI